MENTKMKAKEITTCSCCGELCNKGDWVIYCFGAWVHLGCYETMKEAISTILSLDKPLKTKYATYKANEIRKQMFTNITAYLIKKINKITEEDLFKEGSE